MSRQSKTRCRRGAKHLRCIYLLTSYNRPSGRVLNYDYGTSGGANDLLSRIASLIDNDGTTHLADYTYVGLKRIAQVNAPQPGVMLTYVGNCTPNRTDPMGLDDCPCDNANNLVSSGDSSNLTLNSDPAAGTNYAAQTGADFSSATQAALGVMNSMGQASTLLNPPAGFNGDAPLLGTGFALSPEDIITLPLVAGIAGAGAVVAAPIVLEAATTTVEAVSITLPNAIMSGMANASAGTLAASAEGGGLILASGYSNFPTVPDMGNLSNYTQAMSQLGPAASNAVSSGLSALTSPGGQSLISGTQAFITGSNTSIPGFVGGTLNGSSTVINAIGNAFTTSTKSQP